MKALKDLRQRRGLTQRQLAERAGTSQPTIAAYESGAKSPNLRTLERLARSVGLEAVVDFVPALTREERRSLVLHRAIAERLRESPEPMLERARQNLTKMEQQHPGATPILSRWRSLLTSPTQEIIDVLLDPRPSARELRHVTPFAGALSAPQRAAVYRRFRSTETTRR